jgi:Cu2+-exporting ATPase
MNNQHKNFYIMETSDYQYSVNEEVNKTYQCPMKCEGEKTYDQPGNCPVCNMKLVPTGKGHHH